MMKLEGRTAVLTGATGGIGKATAKKFLQEGANLMLLARCPEKLKNMCDEFAKEKDRVASYVVDVTDESSIANAMQKAVETFGSIDVLFANAGTEGIVKPIQSLTIKEVEDVFQVNFIGVWLTMKHCIDVMKKQKRGSIIAVSSIAGFIGFPGLSMYSASKHAIHGLVKTAALELKDSGVRVNAIAPGPIKNRMVSSIENQINPEESEAVRAQLTSMIPMSRYGTNDEVANLVAFLASDDSSYCTGSIHAIDGGFLAS